MTTSECHQEQCPKCGDAGMKVETYFDSEEGEVRTEECMMCGYSHEDSDGEIDEEEV